MAVGAELRLKCEFYSMKIAHGETLSEYVDRVVGVSEKLRAVGSEIEEKEVCYKVIASVGDEHGLMELAVQIPKEDLCVVALKSKLRSVSSRRGDAKSMVKIKTEALNVDSNLRCYRCGLKGHMSNRCVQGLTCFKCGELGHISPDCDDVRRKMLKKKKKGKKAETNLAF